VSEFWANALLNSALITVGVTFFSGLVAVPLAWLVERTDLPGIRLLDRLVSFPYVLPSYLLAISWIVLANPAVGWLNLLAKNLFGTENVFDIYGLGGIVFIETTALMPIVYISFKAGLSQLSPSLEEAGRLAGASPLQVFARITTPLLKNTLIASLIAVFLASIASFGVPAMIGGPGRVFVLTTGLYSLVKQGSLEALNESFLIAAYMAGFALFFVLITQKLTARKASVVGGSASRPSLVGLGRWRYPLSAAIWAFWLALVGLPLAALVLSSFQLDPGSLAPADFGVRQWRYVLFELPDFRRAIVNSITVALIAGASVVLLSLFVSIAAWKGHYARSRSRFAARVLEGFSSLAYSTPGTVLALVLLFLFAKYPQLGLANTLTALALACSIKYLLLGLKTVEPAAFLVHPSLIEASRLAGAKSWQRILFIWTPLLKRALWAAAILVFMPVLSELTMSILLHGPGTETLGVLLFQLQEYADRTSAAVIGTLLLACLFVFDLIARRSPTSES
jgi:iron(III) transport system permease protein